MDILKDCKHFFYGGGLDSLIHRFRNPTEEEWLVFNIKYIPELDSREYHDDEKEEMGFEPKSVSPFSKWLTKRFEDFKSELQLRFENLKEINNGDVDFVSRTLEDSDCNFSQLRNDIISTSSWQPYYESLLLFVTEVEGIYKKNRRELLTKKVPVNNSTISHSVKRTAIAFDFIGTEKMLEGLYYNLRLETGNFIDDSETSFEEFKRIITSKNVKEEGGRIQFGCETRQACYIIERLKPYCQNLRYILIEESEKFHTQNQPLTAGNISRSLKGKEPKQKDFIDRFFKAYPKP